MNGTIMTPIFINSSGGSGDGKILLAFYIVTNFIFISMFLIRAIIWLFDRSEPFFGYVFGFDNDYALTTITSVFFCLINGSAIFLLLVFYVAKFL